MRKFMRSNKVRFVGIGLGVCILALGTLFPSPADARKASRQDPYYGATPSITVWPRNTPRQNVVCWTPCDQPGAIVMGADPDPFIRSQILRDASGFFGGGGR